MADDAGGAGAGGATTSRRGFLAGGLALGGGALGPPAAGDAIGGGPAANPRLFTFIGGGAGAWSVVSARAVAGEPLEPVERVEIVAGAVAARPEGSRWVLRGVTSNARYVRRDEAEALARVQAPLGRPSATRAALIPIRKGAAWWALPQDERRAIFEEQSRHIAVGLKALPAVARRLHHCRDLGEPEPFDFLTLFDYAPEDEPAFDAMLAEMRAGREWDFVEREVDIRLVRAG